MNPVDVTISSFTYFILPNINDSYITGIMKVMEIIVIVLVKELGKSVLFWIIRLPTTFKLIVYLSK